MHSDRTIFGAAWMRAMNEGLIVDATQLESGFYEQGPDGVLVAAAVSAALYGYLGQASRTSQQMRQDLRHVVRRCS